MRTRADGEPMTGHEHMDNDNSHAGTFEHLRPVERAAAVLDAIAAGCAVEQPDVIAAALTVDTLSMREGGRDLMDAAEGLRTLATTGSLELDDAGRKRAADLADLVRSVGSPLPDAGMG